MSVPAIYMQGGRVLMSGGAAVETPGGTPQITQSSLAAATVGTAYSQAISTTGGTGAVSVYIAQAIPNSLRWIQMTGTATIGGMPQAVETSQVTLVPVDSIGVVGSPVTLSLPSTATGSLAFVSSTTAANSTSGGILAQQQICSGGVPPYIHASPNQAQPWTINWDGFLLGAPTATGSKSIVDTVTDSAGTTITQTLTSTIGSGIMLSNYDYNTSQINLPVGTSGQNYIYNFQAFGGTGSGYSCSVTSGTITPGLSLSTLAITGAPTRAGTFIFTVTVTDGTHNQAYTICHQVWQADTATRPGYNTGTGFFVVNGKLYDPTGKRFTMRGIDRNHYDGASWASGANGGLTGSNTVRDFGLCQNAAATVVSECNAQYLPGSGNYLFPVLTINNFSGTGTTGNTTTTLLASVMGMWLSLQSGISSLDGQVAYNIANEWGPTYANSATGWLYAYEYVASAITNVNTGTSTVTVNTVSGSNPFANSPFALIMGAGGITNVVLNISSTGGSSGAWTITFTAAPTGTYTSGGTLYGGAVGCMRGAGYLGPLVIDAGGSGQDVSDILNGAATIQSSDPQQNCIFSYHPYGSVANYEVGIASATNANPCVLTLNSSLPYHPLVPNSPLFNSGAGHPGNGLIAATGVNVTGSLGMTQLNGSQNLGGGNNCGGSSGAWTVTLAANSTAWGTYTANSARLTVLPFDYRQYIAALAALRSSNVCVACLEFGPGNQLGSPVIAFTGYIDNGSGSAGTELHVVSMLTAGGILPCVSASAPTVNMTVTTNGGSGITYPTHILSQLSGTTGLTGLYTVDTSQLIGTSGSPVNMFIQSIYGTDSSWYGPSTGASPGNVSTGQLISVCEANLMPYCYWAFDDHNIGANQAASYLGWFGMTNQNTTFAVPSDLTEPGMDMVYNPCYGLRTLAQPSSDFA